VYEKDTGCRAMVEQHMTDERQGRITARLQGRRHEELAHWLRQSIERQNRLFGYPDLAPSVDDVGPRVRSSDAPRGFERRLRRTPEPISTADAEETLAGAHAPSTGKDPVFEKPPAAFFGPRAPEVFVSYAWGDDTEIGHRRGKVVDDVCAALAGAGVTIRRDRDEMKPGDLISEFMDRLAEGDFIVVVISDKYLRSEYCMYELFRIYRNCADKPERFQRKVIPLILPDAQLDTMAARLQRAIHWKKAQAEMEPLVREHIDVVGPEFFRKYKLISEFGRNASDMLEHLVDRLLPRDFDRMGAEGFGEVVRLVRAPRS
jgi:internalin A